MPRDDGLADFRELLLLEQSSLATLLLAGALALLPLVLVAVLAMALAQLAWLSWSLPGVLAYGSLAGALAALAYRRGHIPYRRGDIAVLLTFTFLAVPVLMVLTLSTGQSVAVGVLVVVSLLPALLLEVCWRPLFVLTLRRLSHLHLDTLVHESLREHYGDDWQAYRRKIAADLREARRLRDEAADEERKDS